MPLGMHIFTGATPNHGLQFRQAGSALAFAGVMFSIADILQSGVCERFPNLKFVITEFEAGWTAIMLKRLDWAYTRFGGARTGLPHPPSFYWKRQFFVTFEDDALGVRTRDYIGTNTIIWGNDYPHGDSVFPRSQAVLTDVLKDCTRDEIYQMTVKNVVDLYKLPFKLTGPHQSRIADLIEAQAGNKVAAG
jgi:predicted TIM-barrel fold metal-dependent hydrolase